MTDDRKGAASKILRVVAPQSSTTIDLRTLRFALTLSEELHFGRAARLHFISEQPFGRHIRRLEETLGVLLFERTSRHVEVTPEGAGVLMRARQVLREIDQLAPASATRGTGPFLLGVLGYGAGEKWDELRQSWMEVRPRIDIKLVDLDFASQHAAVLSGGVDAALAQYVGPVPGLKFDLLFSERRVVAVPCTSPLAQSRRLHPHELQGEKWVTGSFIGPHFAEWLGDVGTLLGDAPEFAHPSALPTAVAMSGRVSLHGDTAARVFAHPAVRYVPIDGAAVAISIVTRADDERTDTVGLRLAAQKVRTSGAHVIG